MKHCALAIVICSGLIPGAELVRGEPAGEKLVLDEMTRGRCLAVLREGLRSSEFWPAIHAAEGLSLDGHGAEVRAALMPRLPGETDSQRRCGLGRELVRAGDLAATDVLLKVLAETEIYGHTHACESLFKVRQIGDGVLLRRVLEQTGPPKRTIMAAAALGRWGHAGALVKLREYVGADDDETARSAAWVLARLGGDGDLPALRAGARRFHDPLTRAYFEHALATLGDEQGRAALVRNLDHASAEVQVNAAEFAPEARVTNAQAVLQRHLEDEVLDVRIRAAHALLQLARERPPGRDEDVARDVFPATERNPRYSEGSVLALRDGRLLYATTEFIGTPSDFARARLIALTSEDAGRSWVSPRVLQENVGMQNVMSVTLRRIAPAGPAGFDGPIGMFFLVKNGYDDLQVHLRISGDEGETFGDPIRVTAEPGYHVLNNDRVTRLASGRLVVPVASTKDVRRENTFVAACYLSDDAGRTWFRSHNSVPYPGRGAMEPEVLELASGRLLMHFRTRLGHIAVSESADAGSTWSEGRSWRVAGPESPATLRRIPSTGDLLLVWNDSMRPGVEHGQKRTPLTAAVSTDEGRTWSFRRDLEVSDEHTYAYTSIAFHEGRVLLTYYERAEKTGRISSRYRSLPIAWFYESRPGR